MKRMNALAAAAMLTLLLPAAGRATIPEYRGAVGWGPRIGFTVDPDQVHLGAHADFGYFAPGFRFVPNFELGIGDNMTVGALNFETKYLFNSTGYTWTPYLGGGLGLNFVDFQDARLRGDEPGGFPDSSDMEAGLNLLGGLERGLSNGTDFFIECKVGLIQSPDLKLTLGWTFYR